MVNDTHGTNWIYALIGLALVGTIAVGFRTLNRRVSEWSSRLATERAARMQVTSELPAPPAQAADKLTSAEQADKLNRVMTTAVTHGLAELEQHIDEQNAELARLLLETLDERLAALQQQNIDFYAKREGMSSSLLDELNRIIDEQIVLRVQNAQRLEREIGTTETQINKDLKDALALYREDIGHYPTLYEGDLRALMELPEDEDAAEYWNGPYLDNADNFLDIWGHALWYESPGTHNTDGYDLASPGPDGEYDTADDITNW